MGDYLGTERSDLLPDTRSLPIESRTLFPRWIEPRIDEALQDTPVVRPTRRPRCRRNR